jgi:hypothetical protein
MTADERAVLFEVHIALACIAWDSMPLRMPALTPELQWQSRGKRRISQGCTNPRKLRYSFSAHYQCERTYRILGLWCAQVEDEFARAMAVPTTGSLCVPVH